MLFRPAPLGAARLPLQELEADKKACKKIGPCGVGQKALYLSSFYIDRCYYLPYAGISRVFKRIAMSKGGFTGHGLFAAIPYLVAEYDDGRQKQCIFKYEEDVDRLLAVLARQQPQLPLLSRRGEEAKRQKEAERDAKRLKTLSQNASKCVKELSRAADYLNAQPELCDELSAAQRRKRALLLSKPVYRYAALLISLLGLFSLVGGLWSLLYRGGGAGAYVALFGFAAIFLFSGYSMLPTAHNNRRAVLRRAERAEQHVTAYIAGYPSGGFPVPGRYAHPSVLRCMTDALEDGRAQTLPEALAAVKTYLRALNATVQVDQEEYDEVIAIKAMFLNHEYE